MESFWTSYFIGFILCFIGWLAVCYVVQKDKNVHDKMDDETIVFGGFMVSLFSWIGVAVWCVLCCPSLCKLLANRYKAVFGDKIYKNLTAQEAYNIAMAYKPIKDRKEEKATNKEVYRILKKVRNTAKHGDCTISFGYDFSPQVTKKLSNMGYRISNGTWGSIVNFTIEEINKNNKQ